MSSNGASPSNTGQWPQRRPSKRSKMRNGTFIIPSTGERSRRQFTLRTSSGSSAASRARANGGTDGPGDESDESITTPETVGEHVQQYARLAKEKTLAAWAWLNSDQGHAVIKCTLAYLLGSLGTFWDPLSKFLGHRDGKHIVATLTVYFHPARTAGSMLEAIVFALIAVSYAECINLLSMGLVMLGRAHDFVRLAHVLVLVVCLGGGLGFIGWVKQRMNQQLVNQSSTLASIAIISIITKEEAILGGYFSAVKIVQVLKMLALGVSFTAAVNLLVWRKSARLILRQEMVKATVALSDKLSFIARGFLNGDEDDVNTADYNRIRARYNGAYAKMTSTLREAKNEHYVLGHERVYQLDKSLYKSIELLSQAVSGLRSAMDAEFTLRRETPTADSQSGYFGPQSPKMFRTSSTPQVAKDRLSVIDESDEERDDDDFLRPMQQSDPALGRTPAFRYPADIFVLFMSLLGPSMKSLSYTLSEILRDSPFGKDPQTQVTVNDQLRESLRAALSLYNEARGNALRELYMNIQLSRTHSEAVQADIEEVAAACGHFSFSLQAVAEEMSLYLEVLEDLKHVTINGNRSWEWLKVWKYFGRSKKQAKRVPSIANDPEQEDLLPKQPVQSIKRSADPKGIPSQMMIRRDTFNWDAAPQASKMKRKISEFVLKFMRFIAREDITFGIKVGIGAILFAMFAFIPATRPIYTSWRGEWGLLSYMVVVAMTTGASNTTSLARVIGTFIGGSCAILFWLIGHDSGILLAFCGCIMAFVMFYVILVLDNAPLGRISLLAYNVITLYAYSISRRVVDDDDDEGGETPLIFDITFHRVVSVILGIIWGMIVVRLLWPISARRKFREGLSVLYLQLGLIWKRGPLGVKLQTRIAKDYMREGEQVALQRYAFKLDSLRSSAKSEFELRGPFPHEAYGRIMQSTKNILDAFYAMRLISNQHTILSEGERALLDFTAEERSQLCQRICHVLQVLASCVMLEYPLTDAIPSIDKNKDRLLGRIYQFRKEHAESRMASDGNAAVADEKDYALLYAYTLVSTQVAAELDGVRKEIEGLFGVLHEESLLLE